MTVIVVRVVVGVSVDVVSVVMHVIVVIDVLWMLVLCLAWSLLA